MTLPLDVFFDLFQKNYSKEEALQSAKTALVKRKLQLNAAASPTFDRHFEREFEELWGLILKERILKRIVK